MTETQRRPLLAGNWKMYKTRAETMQFFRAFLPLIADVGEEREVAVFPPFVALETALRETADSRVAIGAQTMHYADSGAFTGEVSPVMLVEVGARAVILGHSERRQYFAENDGDLSQKVRAALDHGLLPVLCVGETASEREAGSTEAKLVRQLDEDLALVRAEELPTLVIAYEPIWAIGTGKTATPEMAQETIAFVRERLRERFRAAAELTRVLYGGSVKANNIDALMAQPDVDGVLVGGASLDPQEFARIVRYVA